MEYIGLMSGTSLDGIDAARVRVDGDADSPDWELLAFETLPFESAERTRIHDAITTGGPRELCWLHAHLGERFADAALRLLHAAPNGTRVRAIGSHGQTVWHEPPSGAERGATLQLGCAATIAERTGIDVVSDFRSRDVAVGGQGAPLVPWADRLLFSQPEHPRILLNIGGMANLSRVPARGGVDPVIAFDTGPGNVLIDAMMEIATGGEALYDRDGAVARSGIVDQSLLEELLADPFLQQAPPRSTGRERFGRPLANRLAARVHASDTASDPATRHRDLVATLTEFTARSIADAIHRWLPDGETIEVIVTGGGAHNLFLMERLRALLSPAPVLPGSGVGIHEDAKEAMVFAALAWAHIHGITGNLPRATGAIGARVLGSLTPGRFHEGDAVKA